jgi:hypothetical protein
MPDRDNFNGDRDTPEQQKPQSSDSKDLPESLHTTGLDIVSDHLFTKLDFAHG